MRQWLCAIGVHPRLGKEYTKKKYLPFWQRYATEWQNGWDKNGEQAGEKEAVSSAVLAYSFVYHL